MRSIKSLTAQFPYAGHVEWIGLRKERRGPVQSVANADVSFTGLIGDRRKTTGKRALTLIQQEHLTVIAALMQRGEIDPELLRRNIVVSGINLLALRHHTLKLGTAIIKTTGLCAPCSRMEEALGVGGYNAVRGHGGLTAEIIQEGTISVSDIIVPVDLTTS